MRRAALLLLLLTGCGPANAGMVEEHKEAARKKLAQISDVMLRMRDVKELKEDTLTLSGEDVSVFDSKALEGGNTGILYVPSWKARRSYDTFRWPVDDFHRRWWSWPERALRMDAASLEVADYKELESTLKALEKTRFVIVVVDRELIPADFVDTKEVAYHPGTFRGEFHVFEMETGKHFGGARFEATSSKGLTVPRLSAAKVLERDLRERTHSAVLSRFKVLVPSATLRNR